MLAHIKDNRNQWTVIVDNKSYQFDSTHPEYVKLVKLVSDGDSSEFVKTMSVGTVIQDWSDGLFRFVGGILFYGEESIHEVITARIVQMIKDGVNHKPMLKFLENLYKNPSYRAINELYNFLAHKALPITDDGYFIAYKAVHVHSGPDIIDLEGRTVKSGDCIDKWTQKRYRNNVGDSPTMARHQVDDNCQSHCSHGLHAGTVVYATGYANSGDKVVLVKIHPMNVVSIPTDCECQKLRTCSYEVIGEYESDLSDSYDSRYADDSDDDWDDDYDDWDGDDDDICDDCGDEDCDLCDNIPVIPAGYEEYVPQIGEAYSEDTMIFDNEGDFTWREFHIAPGTICQNPEYDRFSYIRPHININSLYE